MVKVIGFQKITTNRRITLPIEVTEALNVSVEDKLVFLIEDGKIYVEKAVA